MHFTKCGCSIITPQNMRTSRGNQWLIKNLPYFRITKMSVSVDLLLIKCKFH